MKWTEGRVRSRCDSRNERRLRMWWEFSCHVQRMMQGSTSCRRRQWRWRCWMGRRRREFGHWHFILMSRNGLHYSLKAIDRICGVSDSPDAAVRVDEGVLPTHDVTLTGLSVRLLVAGQRIAHAVLVLKARMCVIGVDGRLRDDGGFTSHRRGHWRDGKRHANWRASIREVGKGGLTMIVDQDLGVRLCPTQG